MIQVSQVKANIQGVSFEDIGRARKAFSIVDGKATAFYMVESKSQVDEETGLPKEYKVTYSKEFGFQCTCPSGKEGFANVRNASGVCEHVRLSVACAQEEKAAMAEMSLADACGALAEAQTSKPVDEAAEEFYRNEEARQKQWLADLAFIRKHNPQK